MRASTLERQIYEHGAAVHEAMFTNTRDADYVAVWRNMRGKVAVLAQGHSYPLEEGMVFAFEPKMVFPGEGGVGLENTVVVTRTGYENLTPTENTIFQV